MIQPIRDMANVRIQSWGEALWAVLARLCFDKLGKTPEGWRVDLATQEVTRWHNNRLGGCGWQRWRLWSFWAPVRGNLNQNVRLWAGWPVRLWAMPPAITSAQPPRLVRWQAWQAAASRACRPAAKAFGAVAPYFSAARALACAVSHVTTGATGFAPACAFVFVQTAPRAGLQQTDIPCSKRS